jgi:type I restriction enzyme S subunit
LRGDPEQVTQHFLYQAIASDGMQSTIANSMTGQAITRITLEKLGNYAVSVPSISEQQRIASCLSSLDELITAETQKLEALKTHKRGLMQQLFPSPEDAS